MNLSGEITLVKDSTRNKGICVNGYVLSKVVIRKHFKVNIKAEDIGNAKGASNVFNV